MIGSLTGNIALLISLEFLHPAGKYNDDIVIKTWNFIGEVGLILSEGTVINRLSASNDPNVPHIYGENAMLGWQNVVLRHL
jgi:hypothetical protein